MKIDYAELLELLVDMVATFSRNDCGWILAGYRQLPGRQDPYRILRRLEQTGAVQRRGHGTAERFALTPHAIEQVQAATPTASWARIWDKKWRLVTYDLPESRRKDRLLLCRALHARRLGLLQRSVWIWPHPVEEILLALVREGGIPECFAGLEGDKLLLCSNNELVTAAWDFEEISRRHDRFLRHSVVDAATVARAKNLAELAHLARIERAAYRDAFLLDPCLPRELWPPNYDGVAAEKSHRQLLVVFQARARALAEQE